VAHEFFAQVREQTRAMRLLLDEHLTVDRSWSRGEPGLRASRGGLAKGDWLQVISGSARCWFAFWFSAEHRLTVLWVVFGLP
jgi:hypothetical protein